MPYRQDKDITKEVDPLRRMLIHLCPSRDQSSVYFTQTIDVTKTLEWMKNFEQSTGEKATLVHLFVTFAGRMLHKSPFINRYVAGHKLYQRSDVTISVSAKKELKNGSKLVMLKVPVLNDDDVTSIIHRFKKMLGEGRSEKKLRTEKEANFFLKLPSFMLRLCLKVVGWLERRHWLPSVLVDPDPMYTSVVLANLGSVGLDAAYHHLYEYGNSPFFAVMGAIKDHVYEENGQLKTRKVMDIKYTFDERINDGLATALALSGFKEMMEDPDRFNSGITELDGRPPKPGMT